MSLERQSQQVNCILRILQNSLDKLRISLILPEICENIIIARQRLNGSKYVNCIDLVEEYIKEKNIVHDLDTTETQSRNQSYSLIKMIDLFHQNTPLLDYFNDWLDDLRPFDKSIIDTFQLLLKVTEKRLTKSAISELDREKKIHKVHQENDRIDRKIKVFNGLLKSRHINFKWKQTAEEILIQKYENDLSKCRYDNNIKIKQEIIRSSRNIRQIHAISVFKQKELEEEFERIGNSYERLLTENVQQEKSAQDEKNKLLLQLEALIKKFDQTMEDKIKENMYLQDEYKKQKELFDLFLVEYKREEAEYDRIVLVKEEEEKQKHEQKILLFMMNRSARVIQKHWRRFKRAQKKTGKKNRGRGKPKKK